MEQSKSGREAALLPINQPEEYEKLSDADKATLLQWIADSIEPAQTVYKSTSYSLKHAFEESSVGFYITNGQIKGAMKAAGYAAVDESMVNWSYRIKPKVRGALS
jgi:hypothetical protein